MFYIKDHMTKKVFVCVSHNLEQVILNRFSLHGLWTNPPSSHIVQNSLKILSECNYKPWTLEIKKTANINCASRKSGTNIGAAERSEQHRKPRLDFIPGIRSKTRLQIWSDTGPIHFPLYCPECNKESLISVKQQMVLIIKKPNPLTLSR